MPGFETWREIDVREVGVVGLLEFQINAATDIMLAEDSPLDTGDKLRVMSLGVQLIEKAHAFNWQERGNAEDARKIRFMTRMASSLAHTLAGAGYLAEFEDSDGNLIDPTPGSIIGMVRILRPKEGQ